VGYPHDVKGYILIDPSTDRLIIERIVQFEESHLHAPLVKHAETLVLPSVPNIRDDDSIHSDDTYSDTDSEDFVHANEQVVQPNEETALELQQIPKWAQSTLQEVGNLAGDPLDSRRTRSHHADPSHVLRTSNAHALLYGSIFLIHIPTVRLLAIHYGKHPCRMSMTLS
jgi:hypothetical protein